MSLTASFFPFRSAASFLSAMLPLLLSFESVTGVPEYVGFIYVFALGCLIGSFLNVVIYRVPLEKSVVYPNSACPSCGTPIKPWDNIPVLSWIFLRGKCRSCKSGISIRYPAVELLTGLLFLLVVWQIGFTAFLPIALIFAAVMVALVFIDADHMILPNVITYPLFVFAVLVRLVYPLTFGWQYFSDMYFGPVNWLVGWPAWASSLVGGVLGALAGGGSLWLIGEIWKRARGVEAMGLGDVKMMAGVGMLLGWRLSFLSIFIAAFFGAIVGIAVLAKQKERDMQAQIPFGVFLGPASVVAMLFGESMIAWYLDRFVP
jgi:leader peptidase (prepilin peptidase)/N-methyltransferase